MHEKYLLDVICTKKNTIATNMELVLLSGSMFFAMCPVAIN